MEPAELLDQLLAGPEVEVVGVAEDHGGAESRAPRRGWSVFTVAFVPTGMKAGVGMSPWAVCTVPARAAPSVASRVKHVTRRG